MLIEDQRTYMPVESARPCQGRVKNVREVCCSHQYDSLQIKFMGLGYRKAHQGVRLLHLYLILLKTIHFNKQLMQCLLCMAFPLFSCGTNCIYFINEYDAGSLLNEMQRKQDIDMNKYRICATM